MSDGFEPLGSATARLGAVGRRFCRSDGFSAVADAADLEIVTGFGPTNAPTAGTLSVMIGIVELQRVLPGRMTVVISDLGAWNSRNVEWDVLCHYRDKMAHFLRLLGFDESRGIIRTHLDRDNLVRAGKIARYLHPRDFQQNSEEYLELYGHIGLLGSDVGVMTDSLYTVADVLGPVEQGSGHCLVVSGLEEAYFTQLARLVLERQRMSQPSLGWEGEIGALLFRVVRGFGGYPKMSKSIPQSAIGVGMPTDEVAARLRSDAPGDVDAICDAIDLVSGWDPDDCAHAVHLMRSPGASVREQRAVIDRFVDTFSRFTTLWHDS